MVKGQKFFLRPEDVQPENAPDTQADVEIAVVAQLNLPDQSEETYGLIRRFTAVTMQTLQDLGARPVLVDVTAPEAPDYEMLNRVDGILMLGGGDVDAANYGYDEPVNNEYGRDPVSDERQIKIVNQAIERDATFLGICRGSQILNVACGGTLIPDIQPSDLHRSTEKGASFLDEEITLLSGSKVREIYGTERVTVRSGHHQAVDKLGAGLRATAVADDGVIEGTEHLDKTWVVGVQWHPEDDDGSEADRIALFEAFLAAVRSRLALPVNQVGT